MRPIDADELIKSLRNSFKELKNICLEETDEASKELREAQMVVFVDVILRTQHAPTIDMQPKWISVKDRLPEDCEDVLVLVSGNVDVGYHSPSGYYWECYSYRNNNVTHWMPLPEPPKEE